MKNDKKCFIVSPIGAENSDIRNNADEVMKFLLKPILDELGYEIIRADKITNSQNISKNIITNIVEADLIIADLSTHNPNVFYELAVSHTLAKPTIQIIKKGETIPFDINQQRTIVYELTLSGAEKAKETLKNFIKNLQENNEIENPVLDVIGLNKINDLKSEDFTVTDALKELTNEIKRVNESVVRLEAITSNPQNKTNDLMTTEIVKNMSSEDRMGMLLMEKLLSNPNTSESLLNLMINNKK